MRDGDTPETAVAPDVYFNYIKWRPMTLNNTKKLKMSLLFSQRLLMTQNVFLGEQIYFW